MLKITAIGNLTNDVELKVNETTGKPYAILRIASDRRYRDRDGNRLTDFISIKVRGPLAERCAAFAWKGCKLAAVGDFETITFEDDPTRQPGFLIKATPYHPNQRYRVRRNPNACYNAPGTSASRCNAESGSRQDEGHLYRNTGDNQCHSSTGTAAPRTAGIRPGTGTQGDAADEASADGAEQTASEYPFCPRHIGNGRYSAKCGGSFTQKYQGEDRHSFTESLSKSAFEKRRAD